MGSFRVAAPSVSLPKGGGAIRDIGEKFSANAVTGTGSMSVPVPLSQGRSGFSPQLALSYDSGSGNGSFGLGWSLSLPAITRKTDKGLPQYDDEAESDEFILSGAEDLVPVFRQDSNGQHIRDRNGKYQIHQDLRAIAGVKFLVRRYRPRTEGLFSRIERWTRVSDGDIHWRSISKDNVTTCYGQRESEAEGAPVLSRIADPDAPERIFTWLICKSFDDKGNAISYSYLSEDGRGVDLTLASEANRTDKTRSANRHLKRIQYGNAKSLLADGEELSPLGPSLSSIAWHFEVVLDYGEGHISPLSSPPKPGDFVQVSFSGTGAWSVREDPFSTHRSCFEVRNYRLCSRILMFHHFEKEMGTKDCLVRSLDLQYERTPFASYLSAATQSGYKLQDDGSYLRKSFPPVVFEYSRSPLEKFVSDDFPLLDIDPESLENLPVGTSGSHYQWVDLDGEGISGVLAEQDTGWYFKSNLGNGRLDTRQPVALQPSLVGFAEGQCQLLDIESDGRLEVVSYQGAAPGYFERSDDSSWEPLRPFLALPNITWRDPNLKFVDLTGDGTADILVTEGESLTWFKSLGKEGFEEGLQLRISQPEEKGPTLLFADQQQAVFLADMSGDGLSDLVRINQGEICYWPNQGYGQFGPRVTMDQSPWIDAQDQFDHRRIHLADTDGSGTADIIYHGTDGAQIYLNQAGNGWSSVRSLTSVPSANTLTSLQTVDLLGNGTICLVWSSSLPADTRRSMKYVDLMQGQKPHLLVASANNLGARTAVQYASSTKFYLADKADGKPWVTRLPFPVHVVERVETYDFISRNRFVTRYAYHHGHFDGVEREFRGFGMVEQWDTEEFATFSNSDIFPVGDNVDHASHIPPIYTRSWFHTGVFLGRDRVSNYFSGLLDQADLGEYYREPRVAGNDLQAQKLLLEDTVLPADLSVEEEREACRALRGSMLRQEVYASDSTATEDYPFGQPYVVTEQKFSIEKLQPQGNNRHSVYFAHPRESIAFHYERDPDHPRIGHTLNLEVDGFGNVLKSVSVGYGRRVTDPALSAIDSAVQKKTLVTYTQNSLTNPILNDDSYRVPLPAEVRTYELIGYRPQAGKERFEFDDFVIQGAAGLELSFDSEIPYHSPPTSGKQRRLIEHVRTLYRRDDLNGSLALGKIESRAIPFESYKLALTPELVTEIFGERVTPEILRDGGYVSSAGDENSWMPSGRSFFSPHVTDAPDQELQYAHLHFFQPCRYRDPFHTDQTNIETTVIYDAYDLLVLETQDALGNRVTAGSRDANPNPAITENGLDYRVLQPKLVMDPNRNRVAVAFDALGMVVGTAVMGKPEESCGDTLEDFNADLSDDVISAHLDKPLDNPQEILQRATTRLVYDLFAYSHPKDKPALRPAAVYTLARETHDSNLAPGQATKIQHSFSYSDGFGREIQKKLQAESGPVPQRDTQGQPVIVNGRPQMSAADLEHRWTGSGWTVFNNKGKPVRQFEPFFTETHRFEFGIRVGVGTILFYDPPGRVIGTLHPNHTWEKVIFNPWKQETWDVNDTVLIADPSKDPQLGEYFSRLPKSDYVPTWYTERINGSSVPERQAAQKSAVHAGTPTVVHLDSLGRTYLTVAHNRFQTTGGAGPSPDEYYATRVTLDIEGNQRQVTDAQDRIVMRYDYDLRGNRIHSASMEAGERWMLNDVVGKALYAWDSRDHRFRTTYDRLRRPEATYLQQGTATEIIIERICYGESQPDPEVRNLRGHTFAIRDQAGYLGTSRYDFQGNLLLSERWIAKEYKQPLDWTTSQDLEQRSYQTITRFDALNRPIELTTPDNSLVLPVYNEANLLERVDAYLAGDAAVTAFVANIDYNSKGQRTRIDYGNGATTTHEYDPLTFRLTRLATKGKGSTTADLQDLNYTYDPVGNITSIADKAQQTIFFNNQQVEASSDYVYDAIYRLIEATGREHLGQNGQPVPSDAFDSAHIGLPHPGDGNAMGAYRENYLYDAVGNILEMQHRGSSPANAGWTRKYTYHEPSLIEGVKYSNRLSVTEVGGHQETYTYDAHGNITQMAHLSVMQWDFRDQLAVTSRTAGSAGDTTYYVYDSKGQRVRKINERPGALRRDERIYIGGFEIYREYASDGTAITLERETLHIMDDKQRVAMVERRTTGTAGELLLIRYQFSNHLGTACLELDQEANIISYEEYLPYGSTAYQAARAGLDKNRKRYRYTGKERDEETGLQHHGARYCATWLGRWTACDSTQLADGINVFAYVGNNPIRHIDSAGTSRDTHGCAEPSREHQSQYPSKDEHDTPHLNQQALRKYFESPSPKAVPEKSTEATRRAEIAQSLPASYEVSSGIVKPAPLMRRLNAWFGTTPLSAVFGGSRMSYMVFPKLDPLFDKYAAKHSLSPDFVKAIAWQEMTHGWYDEGLVGKSQSIWHLAKELTTGKPASSSIRPMNVQESWGPDLGFNKDELQDPEKNIAIGTELLARIWARTKDPTVEKVATLYNGLSSSKVSAYGRDTAKYLETKPWRESVEREKQNQIDWEMMKRAFGGDPQAGMYLMQRMSGS